MSRPLRIEYEGACFHVIQRGTEKRDIYSENANKERFLGYLEEIHRRYSAKIHCYCLMDNHYHLLLSTPNANLSKIMHYINTSYAVYYNKLKRRVGPLFQGRYKAILVQADEYVCELSRYIHNNPVKERIEEKAEDYKWSTYAEYIGKAREQEWIDKGIITDSFGGNKKERIEKYKDFVASKIVEEKELNEKVYGGIIMGNASFIKDVINTHVKGREVEGETETKELLAYVEPTKEMIENIIKKYERDEGEARKIGVYVMRKYTSKTLKEIAKEMGGIAWNGISKINKRMAFKRQIDITLDKKLNKIEQEMYNVQP